MARRAGLHHVVVDDTQRLGGGGGGGGGGGRVRGAVAVVGSGR